MKNIVVLYILGAVMVAVIGYVYITGNEHDPGIRTLPVYPADISADDPRAAEQAAPPVLNAESPDAEAIPQLPAGMYVAYSGDAVREYISANPSGRAVLFFHAGWCPTCRSLHKALTAAADTIPPDIAIFKVNYDTEKELKRIYRITRQHTLVLLDSNLQPVDTWYGSQNLDDVIARIHRAQ